MTRTLVLPLALATALGGCTLDLNTKGICVADPAQAWVGQVFTDRTAHRIRDRSLATKVRVQRPGDMATMEFDRRRVNVFLDEAGRVSRVTCG